MPAVGASIKIDHDVPEPRYAIYVKSNKQVLVRVGTLKEAFDQLQKIAGVRPRLKIGIAKLFVDGTLYPLDD